MLYHFRHSSILPIISAGLAASSIQKLASASSPFSLSNHLNPQNLFRPQGVGNTAGFTSSVAIMGLFGSSHKKAVEPVIPTTASALEAHNKLAEAAEAGSSGGSQVETATFANGCFWGTEHMFGKYFGPTKGIVSTQVGFIGGHSKNPSYREVCGGDTNHAEAVRLEYDTKKVSYAELVEFFYRTHDPTQVNRQGPDVGSQYRSAIFTHTPEQLEIAKKVTQEVQAKYFDARGKKIATQIEDANENDWYTAEQYHQKYLDNNPGGYECPTHVLHW